MTIAHRETLGPNRELLQVFVRVSCHQLSLLPTMLQRISFRRERSIELEASVLDLGDSFVSDHGNASPPGAIGHFLSKRRDQVIANANALNICHPDLPLWMSQYALKRGVVVQRNGAF